jgi:ABC-type uncharacterized transport system permease subunit
VSRVRGAAVKDADIVLVNKKGRRFHAIVLGRQGQELKLLPITSGISWMHCSIAEVEDHWINRKRFAKP